MSSLPPPPAARPPAAMPVRPPAPPAPAAAPKKVYGVTTGRQAGAQRLLIYGPGGVGKTKLASFSPKPIFLDLEGGSNNFDVARVTGVDSFADVRAWLQGTDCDPFSTVWIDTGTKLEELAQAHVLATVPAEKPGVRLTGLESYPFGKGFQHLYDAMCLILQDCDRLVRKGKNVGLIAHSCTAEAPNPAGDNWLRYEPRLQHPKKPASVRERVLGWADHVMFIGYDVAAERGKGTGGGTRTIYTTELPSHLAKTRGPFKPEDVVPPSLPYQDGDGSIWSVLLGGVS